MKQGYRVPFSVKFILNELGDSGKLPIWTQSGQHCAEGFFPYRRIQSFNGISFDLTRMRVALMRWIEVFRFIFQHVHSRWTEYKVILGVTGHRSLVLSQYNLLTLNTESVGA